MDKGIFDIHPVSKVVKDNIALFSVSYIIWEKFIDQIDENLFEVTFNVNRNINKYKLIKENDTWKIDDFEIENKELDSDADLSKEFKTYDEAIEYASSVMPRNVFDDKKLAE